MVERDSNDAASEEQEPFGDAPATRLRDQHGAVTKRVILQAARKRFAELGYAGTSVKDLAKDSGVAVQTLYSAFGSKSGVLLGLIDLIDEEADVLPLFRAMMAVEDPRDAVPLFARLRRQIRERCGDIVSVMRAGARIDADIETAWAEGLRRRHGGIARVTARLEDAGALRPGVDATKAADILASLATDDVCDVLVLQRGWSFDDYERWLAGAMVTLVLDTSQPAP